MNDYTLEAPALGTAKEPFLELLQGQTVICSQPLHGHLFAVHLALRQGAVEYHHVLETDLLEPGKLPLLAVVRLARPLTDTQVFPALGNLLGPLIPYSGFIGPDGVQFHPRFQFLLETRRLSGLAAGDGKHLAQRQYDFLLFHSRLDF